MRIPFVTAARLAGHKPQTTQNPMNSPITLHEYRLSHPRSASIPTITQSGFLGQILERQRRNTICATRRKAARRRLLIAPFKALFWLWRILNTPVPRRIPHPFAGVAAERLNYRRMGVGGVHGVSL
jgi:hypothetical protein